MAALTSVEAAPLEFDAGEGLGNPTSTMEALSSVKVTFAIPVCASNSRAAAPMSLAISAASVSVLAGEMLNCTMTLLDPADVAVDASPSTRRPEPALSGMQKGGIEGTVAQFANTFVVTSPCALISEFTSKLVELMAMASARTLRNTTRAPDEAKKVVILTHSIPFPIVMVIWISKMRVGATPDLVELGETCVGVGVALTLDGVGVAVDDALSGVWEQLRVGELTAGGVSVHDLVGLLGGNDVGQPVPDCVFDEVTVPV